MGAACVSAQPVRRLFLSPSLRESDALAKLGSSPPGSSSQSDKIVFATTRQVADSTPNQGWIAFSNGKLATDRTPGAPNTAGISSSIDKLVVGLDWWGPGGRAFVRLLIERPVPAVLGGASGCLGQDEVLGQEVLGPAGARRAIRWFEFSCQTSKMLSEARAGDVLRLYIKSGNVRGPETNWQDSGGSIFVHGCVVAVRYRGGPAGYRYVGGGSPGGAASREVGGFLVVD